jgi:hypothetical protein
VDGVRPREQLVDASALVMGATADGMGMGATVLWENTGLPENTGLRENTHGETEGETK